MGYTTEFDGHFNFSRPLTNEEKEYINRFSDSRRMIHNTKELEEKFQGEYGLNGDYGADGGYFVGDENVAVIEHNTPPGQIHGRHADFEGTWVENQKRIKNGECQPGLWCKWHINDDGKLEWNGIEKFYKYTEWLKYMITHFFDVWNVKLNGEVLYQGEEDNDNGNILVINSVVYVDTDIKTVRKMKLDNIEENLDI